MGSDSSLGWFPSFVSLKSLIHLFNMLYRHKLSFSLSLLCLQMSYETFCIKISTLQYRYIDQIPPNSCNKFTCKDEKNIFFAGIRCSLYCRACVMPSHVYSYSFSSTLDLTSFFEQNKENSSVGIGFVFCGMKYSVGTSKNCQFYCYNSLIQTKKWQSKS